MIDEGANAYDEAWWIELSILLHDSEGKIFYSLTNFDRNPIHALSPEEGNRKESNLIKDSQEESQLQATHLHFISHCARLN